MITDHTWMLYIDLCDFMIYMFNQVLNEALLTK